MKTLILAGNAAQAADWCRENHVSLSTCRYVFSPDQVRGYKNPPYVVTGTFWNNPRSIDIWRALVVACPDNPPVAPPDIEPFLKQTLPVAPVIVPVPAPPMKTVPTSPCLQCGKPKPDNEWCPDCGEPEFKHIEPPPPPKKKFKSIKK